MHVVSKECHGGLENARLGTAALTARVLERTHRLGRQVDVAVGSYDCGSTTVWRIREQELSPSLSLLHHLERGGVE